MLAEIDEYQKSACKKPGNSGTEYCTNARELAEWSKRPYNLQQLEKRYGELAKFIERNGGMLPPESRFKIITTNDGRVIIARPTPEDFAMDDRLDQIYLEIQEQISCGPIQSL